MHARVDDRVSMHMENPFRLVRWPRVDGVVIVYGTRTDQALNDPCTFGVRITSPMGDGGRKHPDSAIPAGGRAMDETSISS